MKKIASSENEEATNVELLKFEFEKRTYWWDFVAKLLAPILAATVVAFIGAGVLADLKSIHLETGTVAFENAKADSSCICRNTVRKRLVNVESPVDISGKPCALSPNAVQRNDRPDIGEWYYLTSDFEPHKSVADRRCYRQASVSVKQGFSRVPRVSLQIAWIDARTYDETDTGLPVLVGGGAQPQVQKV